MNEINIIKQQILDYCTEFRTCRQIAALVGIKRQRVYNYLETLMFNGYMERSDGVTQKETKLFLYRTVIPNLEDGIEKPKPVEWSWIPIGLKVIEHDVKGRKIEADSYADKIKLSDKMRRRENKSGKVHVSGSTLMGI